MRSLLTLGMACVALAGCGDGADGRDLPAGWEAAERVEELRQAPCGGSPLFEFTEELEASAAESGIAVNYDHAHFRCAQDVEAYVRRASGALDLLVQPIDMNPSSVAACDCLYDITMHVPAARGDYRLKLYRRWDNMNSPTHPVKVGEATVSVE